jgi:tRNA(Ile)-lysidine synthase
MTSAAIEAYAAATGAAYREDRTNAENDAQRNRIRNEVFPEFARINPSFVRTLNSDMGHFSQAEAIVEDYFLEAEAGVTSDDGSVIADKLLALKHWKYVLFRITEPCGFSSGTLEALTGLLTERAEGRGTFAGKRFYSPTHMLETNSKGFTLHLRKDGTTVEGGSITVCGPGIYNILRQTVRVETIPFKPGMTLKQPAGTLICDAAGLPFPFTLRTWQAGDWMRPFGMSGKTKKLSDLFTDSKMSISDKDSAVIVYSTSLDKNRDGHVAAVAGMRMDEALRVAKGSEQIVRITIL